MITDRYLEQTDMSLLELSLASDEYHRQTTPEFFTEEGCACKIYEDDKGLICFVKGSPVLRLDIQWVSNTDRRNVKVMLECFPELARRAKENGFREICFQSDNPLLIKFCVKRLGFTAAGDELRKIL